MQLPNRIFFAAAAASVAMLLSAAAPAGAQTGVYIADPDLDGEVSAGDTETEIIIRPRRSTDPFVHESRLRAEVAERLGESPSLAGSNISVSSRGTDIVLTGTVAEAEDLDGAELIARRTPGVAGVINDLRVQPVVVVVPQAANDGELARQVSQHIAADLGEAMIERESDYGYEVESRESEINVRADNGQVTLSGYVPSYDALGRTVSLARTVPGVTAVVSQLRIEPIYEGSVQSPGRFAKPGYKPF